MREACLHGAGRGRATWGTRGGKGGRGEARDGTRTKTYRRSCSLAGFGVALGKEGIAVTREVAHGCGRLGGEKCGRGLGVLSEGLALIDGLLAATWRRLLDLRGEPDGLGFSVGV